MVLRVCILARIGENVRVHFAIENCLFVKYYYDRNTDTGVKLFVESKMFTDIKSYSFVMETHSKST